MCPSWFVPSHVRAAPQSAADMELGDYGISASTICKAIEIGKYFLVHSSYAYPMMGGDLNIKKAKFVLAKLSKLGKSEIKRSDTFQACQGGHRLSRTDWGLEE